MINYLNNTVWATIQPSPIHGIGVFAIRDIPKGQKIYAAVDFDKQWLQVDDMTGLHDSILTLIKQRWPYALKGAPFLSPNDDVRLVSFMNHFKIPNYNPKTDRALVDIPEGTEITEDYGEYAPVDNSTR